MNLAVLKSELQTDPEGMGYAALIQAGDHAQIATVMNTLNRPGKRSVSTKQVRKRLMMSPEGAWGAMRAIVGLGKLPDGSAAPFQLVALCATVLDACSPGSFEDFDYQFMEVKGPIDTVLAALVSAGLVSAETSASITGQSDSTVSRSEQLFGEGVFVEHITIARALRS